VLSQREKLCFFGTECPPLIAGIELYGIALQRVVMSAYWICLLLLLESPTWAWDTRGYVYPNQTSDFLKNHHITPEKSIDELAAVCQNGSRTFRHRILMEMDI
jgi:hypothetical protein